MRLDEINVTKKEFGLMVESAREISEKNPFDFSENEQKLRGYAALMKDGSISATYDILKLLGTKTNKQAQSISVNRNGDVTKIERSDYDKPIIKDMDFVKAIVMIERPSWAKEITGCELSEKLEISGNTLDLIKRQKINIPIIYCNEAGTKYFIFKNSESAVYKLEGESI